MHVFLRRTLKYSMTFEEEKNHHAFFLAVGILLVLSALALVVFFKKGYFSSIWSTSPGNTNQVETVPSVSQNPTIKLDNSIVVRDQPTALTVTVDSVQIKAPGFLVIRRMGKDGTPKFVVGSSGYLAAGSYKKSIKVPFFTGTNKPNVVAGDSFFMMIVEDSGNMKYDEADKDPALDASGKLLAVKFTIL